jgi:hypothetical protein
LIITGDFFLSDPQISKEDKDWLYPQMIKAIKKIVANSIVLVFSPTILSNLILPNNNHCKLVFKNWIIKLKIYLL